MINRRQMIGGSVSGFFAYALRNRGTDLFAKSAFQGSAKRCVVLWMEGGPSQLDTFDPKPETGTGGPFKPLATTASDIQISETLPQLAKQMNHLSVIRNLTSTEGEHLRATYYLHTGFQLVPSFPRPAMGSVISRETPDSDFPKYVSLGATGIGPAYMGPEHTPFSVADADAAINLFNTVRRRKSRVSLLRELDSSFSNKFHDARMETRKAAVEKIERMASTRFAKSLDVRQSSKRDLSRYGESAFGRRCLIARQLLDLGVAFVEVQQSGWDTHSDNFNSVKRLCEQIDRPFAALVEDLKSSGMYDDTLIIWMGEFGRTPTINGQMGRDHFPAVTPVVIGGGPINAGVAVGQTSNDGRKIEGHSYHVADLFATIFNAFGVAPDKEYTTDFDSPTTATEDGKVIAELV